MIENNYQYIESVKCMNDDHNHIHHVKKFIEPEFVDLGLPSGTLWAEYNIGVNPKDLDTAEKWYGNYYAWGEIKTKTDYSESTYTYTDDPEVLPAEHDVATVIYGSEFRMPTRAECQELIDNTTNQWVIDYNGISGLNGRIFTNKADSNKYIFIPTAGAISYSTIESKGMSGSIWSASPHHYYLTSAFSFSFNSELILVYIHARYGGFPVRPVKSVI